MREDNTEKLTTDEILRLILSKLDALEEQQREVELMLNQVLQGMIEMREELTNCLDRMIARFDNIDKKLDDIEKAFPR